MIKYPDFFIIGAPKCGTTSLAAYLADHPKVSFSKVKEPNYYNRDMQNQFIKNEDEYLRLFPNNGKERLKMGEASVWYLYSKVAVREIRVDNNNAKFLIMLRNPVEMALSLHQQNILSLNEDIRDFERAWELQILRTSGLHIPSLCTDPKLLEYGPVCKTGEQIERVYTFVNKESVKILFLEDLIKHPISFYLSVLNFLELQYDGRVEFENINPAQQSRVRCIDVLLKKARNLRLKLGIPLIKNPITPVIYSLNRKKITKQQISQEFIDALYKYFREDIMIIEELTGRNLNHWKSSTLS